MNLQQLYAEALETLGEHRISNARSRKYWTYSRGMGGFFYLGSSGAVRAGRTIADSVSLSEWAKRTILRHARVQRAKAAS